MKIKGITFMGTRTAAQPEMTAFVRDVMGFTPVSVEGVDADFFELPDGSTFAVTPPDDDGATERTVGFLVDDAVAAVEELRAAGVETDEVASSERQRYVHFRAPDGHLYELVEELG